MNLTNTAKSDDRRLRIGDEKYLYDISSYSEYINAAIFYRTKINNFQMTESILLPPIAYLDRPASLVPTKLVFAGVNRARSPIFTGKWLRDGVHLVTGASSGEISLWNGLKYHQELNFPAHDSAIRTIAVSHDGLWLVSADHNGQFKYWQSNLNLVNNYSGHSDPVRGLSFAPTDIKFASCSDDGLIKIWDFETGICETSMQGHGTDVKCLDWHPYKGLIVSGSKDSQQPIMLWDPRASSALCTIHIHKSAIMSIGWNCSGNLFASASKDKSIKLFDIRAMKQFQVFKGHKKEPYNLTWHPLSDRYLSSASVDGSLIHWLAGEDKELIFIDSAHDGVIWELSWHPEGHIFSSVSNDQSTKIWVRNIAQRIVPSVEEQPIILATKTEITNIHVEDNSFFDDFKDLNPSTDGMMNSSSTHISFPPPRHPYFQCYPIEFQTDNSNLTANLPTGVVPEEEFPTRAQSELDVEYIFDPSCNFREPVEIKMKSVYTESDEEIEPVIFSGTPPMLNYIPQQTLNNIYKNYSLDVLPEKKLNQTSRNYVLPHMLNEESMIQFDGKHNSTESRYSPRFDINTHANKHSFESPQK